MWANSWTNVQTKSASLSVQTFSDVLTDFSASSQILVWIKSLVTVYIHVIKQIKRVCIWLLYTIRSCMLLFCVMF